MKLSELSLALAEEFGAAYGGVLMRDHWLGALGCTGEQALERGETPKRVWESLCDEMQVPLERRHGRGMREPKP